MSNSSFFVFCIDRFEGAWHLQNSAENAKPACHKIVWNDQIQEKCQAPERLRPFRYGWKHEQSATHFGQLSKSHDFKQFDMGFLP
jgi:hypothetical protein